MRHPLLNIPLIGTTLACILTVCIGCSDPRIIFSERAEIGGAGWTYSDSITFDFDAPDTTQHYDVLLEFAHERSFAWENAYVEILTGFPDGRVIADTISLELADDFGQWVGKCRGDECRAQIPLQENVRFPEIGSYALTFVQFMRQETIPGITSLELTIRISPELQ